MKKTSVLQNLSLIALIACFGVMGCDENDTCQQGNTDYETKDPSTIEPGENRGDCSAGEHVFDTGCEADSLENCGKHGLNCTTFIEGWESGACIEGVCTLTGCKSNYVLEETRCKKIQSNEPTSCTPPEHQGDCSAGEHVFDTGCEADSMENCGKHGLNCTTFVEGWESGACVEGVCTLTGCKSGYVLEDTHCKKIQSEEPSTCTPPEHQGNCKEGEHPFQDGCEADSLSNCGQHGLDCSTHYPGWANGSCLKGVCSATGCQSGYSLSGNSCVKVKENQSLGVCVPEFPYSCPRGSHCVENKCQCVDDFELCNGVCTNVKTFDNCGACGNKCSSNQYCDQKTCKPLSELKVGGLVTFGHYEQDENIENGPEPLVWRVLDRDGSKYLLLSEYVIDSFDYYTTQISKFLATNASEKVTTTVPVTWENSSIRAWLNGYRDTNIYSICKKYDSSTKTYSDCVEKALDYTGQTQYNSKYVLGSFIRNAFTEEEQAKIVTTHLKNEADPDSGYDNGKDTDDKIFLLSLNEVNKYLKTKAERYAEVAGTKIKEVKSKLGGNFILSQVYLYIVDAANGGRNGGFKTAYGFNAIEDLESSYSFPNEIGINSYQITMDVSYHSDNDDVCKYSYCTTPWALRTINSATIASTNFITRTRTVSQWGEIKDKTDDSQLRFNLRPAMWVEL